MGGVKLIYRKILTRFTCLSSQPWRSTRSSCRRRLSLLKICPLWRHMSMNLAVSELTFECVRNQEKVIITLPARSVFVAAGTSPNTLYEKSTPTRYNYQVNILHHLKLYQRRRSSWVRWLEWMSDTQCNGRSSTNTVFIYISSIGHDILYHYSLTTVSVSTCNDNNPF